MDKKQKGIMEKSTEGEPLWTSNNIELELYLLGYEDMPRTGNGVYWEVNPHNVPTRGQWKRLKNTMIKPPIRKLNDREMNILVPVFGFEVNYFDILVQLDGPGWELNRSKTIFNVIVIMSDDIDDNGNVNHKVLIHEVAHVWQYQKKMGPLYATEAIGGYIKQYISGGKYDPYDYQKLEGNIPWDQWGPDAQAQWIEDHERLPGDDLIKPKKKYNSLINHCHK